MRLNIKTLVLTLATATLLVACEKSESYSFVVPSESILLSMPGDSGTTNFDSSNIASVEVTTVPNGWVVDNIDLYKGTISVTAPSTFDNDEVREGNLTLTGYTPTGSSKSITIYLAILPNEDVDFSAAPANCFIATKPATRYLFDAYTGGTSTPLATASVEVLWQSRIDLIKYLDLRDGKASFYLEEAVDDDDEPLGTVYAGNALIAARDAAGDIIWSWHIWVTNNDPTANTITLNGKTLMNINLGAECNSEGEKDADKILGSYGMFYQWGNKNPLVGPFSWNFSGNEDGAMYDIDEERIDLGYTASTATTGNSAWSTANPATIVTGSADNDYDWLYDSHDDTLWSTTHKTENDPCPAGWRVPDSSVYATLTIAAADDALPWQEAQQMYGWHLEDMATGTEHFFAAAGRRNYLDGRLDIVNTNPTRPIPWSGYYWTATTVDSKAVAMYFDLNSTTRTWNGFDNNHALQRANALPLRCVKE